MKSFFKDNAVLVAGISLPLLLALVFFASAQISTLGRIPPKTKVIFGSDYTEYDERRGIYDFRVTDAGLIFEFVPPDDKNNKNYIRYSSKPRLFVYDPVENSTEEVSLPDYDTKKPFKTELEHFKGIKISKQEKSPDGFLFEKQTYRSDVNLMTALFGGGASHRNGQCSLQKENFRKEIPQTRRNNCNLIGWIIE